MHHLTATISRKSACADDLAILHSESSWQALEGTLNEDMTILSSFLRKLKLKLSTTKTMSAPSVFIRRHGVSLTFLPKCWAYFFVPDQLSQLQHKAERVTYVASTFGDSMQKVSNSRWAFEATEGKR